MKFAYLFLHTDEWKSYASMNPSENDKIFRDTKKGRASLWNVIKSAINNDSMECDNHAKVRDFILHGDPMMQIIAYRTE